MTLWEKKSISVLLVGQIIYNMFMKCYNKLPGKHDQLSPQTAFIPQLHGLFP